MQYHYFHTQIYQTYQLIFISTGMSGLFVWVKHLSDRGYFPPVVAEGGGGAPRDTLRKPLSPRNFVMNITLYLYIHTLKTTIFKQRNTKKFTVSKWWPNSRFSFCVISISTKIWKTFFPKKVFNGIWPTIGDHEKRLFRWDFRGKEIFPHPKNANLC